MPVNKNGLQPSEERFVKLLFTLPRNEELLTDEAIKKAGPYLPVIFDLTEKDLEKYKVAPYGIAVVLGSLCSREEYKDYEVSHFADIRHPEEKLFLGSILFEKGAASPEIVQFLRDALEDEERAKELSEMIGPHFQDFKARLMVEKN